MSQETKREIAVWLHMLFCYRSHASQMDQLDDTKLCAWYLEEQTAECWERRSHYHQLEMVEGFMQTLKTKEPELALKVLKDVLKHVQALAGICKTTPGANVLLNRLLTDLLSLADYPIEDQSQPTSASGPASQGQCQQTPLPCRTP